MKFVRHPRVIARTTSVRAYAYFRTTLVAERAKHSLLPERRLALARARGASVSRRGDVVMTPLDHVPHADALVREYLLFRGFTSALRAFDADARADLLFRATADADADADAAANANADADVARGDACDRVADALFERDLPALDVRAVCDTLALLRARFFARLDASFAPACAKLETSILRLLIVHALRRGRKDVVDALFAREGERLAANSDEWHAWFAACYVARPEEDARYRAHFAKGWGDAVRASTRNFLAEAFRATPAPAMLRFGEERRRRSALEKRARDAELECVALRATLEEREDRAARIGGGGLDDDASEARSISHWFPYDRVRVVNADP